MAARFKALKLVDGKCQVQSPVVLVDLAVQRFHWFLRNSRKYGLGSLRKTPPMEGHTTYSPRSHKLKIGLKSIQPTYYDFDVCAFTKFIYKLKTL